MLSCRSGQTRTDISHPFAVFPNNSMKKMIVYGERSYHYTTLRDVSDDSFVCRVSLRFYLSALGEHLIGVPVIEHIEQLPFRREDCDIEWLQASCHIYSPIALRKSATKSSILPSKCP